MEPGGDVLNWRSPGTGMLNVNRCDQTCAPPRLRRRSRSQRAALILSKSVSGRLELRVKEIVTAD